MRRWRLFLTASAALYAGGCLPVPPVTVLQPAPRVEVRPTAAVRIPTGPHRRTFAAAATLGFETAVELRPTFHILGTLGWSPTHVRFAGADHGVNVFHYDLGTEYNLVVPLDGGWQLKPFLGLGAGARSYLYEADGFEAHHPITAYGVLGSELQQNLAALRIESRLYLYDYEMPTTGALDTRREVAILVGFAYHFPVERDGSR